MPDISPILKRVLEGHRLSLEEGVALLNSSDLLALGAAANIVRQRLHPENRVTFIIDRNINYTNICTCRCKFCAFWKDPDSLRVYY
ncbi:hypothetical protein N752_26775 [Desulforamulus aquiferis]|nr:hypothetical protein N752_26775 [Desulforamulus aquiferis]